MCHPHIFGNFKMSRIIFLSGIIFLLVGCSVKNSDENFIPTWQTISSEEATTIMNEEGNFILVDVRTQEEFLEARIYGAILIPYDEIMNRAEAELPNKNAVILIYCRRRRRSALAVADLATLGYTEVYDFGGILNWQYETVRD